MTGSLSLTLAPPRIATNGRAGLASTLANASSSCCIKNPAAHGMPAIPLTELWARLFPRPAAGAAWLALMLCLGWLAVQQTQSNSRRQRATELVTVSGAAALSDPNLLQDFDAIRRLPQPEDEELFAVLSTVPAN